MRDKMIEVKQGRELEEQEGLEEQEIVKILETKDVNKAYKILMQSAILYYHLQGQNTFETENEYFQAFPFTQHITDCATVVMPMLRKYDKTIW